MTVLLVPTTAQPQQFLIVLGEIQYSFTLKYMDVDEGGWILDIENSDGTPIAAGLPLVTGCSIIGQFEYLGIGDAGALLFVSTDGYSFTSVPTYENLGTEANLYYEVPDGA